METNEDYFNAWIQFKGAEIGKEIKISIFKREGDLELGTHFENPTIFIPEDCIIDAYNEGIPFNGGEISFKNCPEFLNADDEDELGYEQFTVDCIKLAHVGENKIILYFDPFSVSDSDDLTPKLRPLLESISAVSNWISISRMEVNKNTSDVRDECLEKVSYAYKASLEKERKEIYKILEDEKYRLKLLQKTIESKRKDLERLEEDKNKDIAKNPEVVSYYDLLRSNGMIIDAPGNDYINCVMPPFKIKGVEIGPLLVRYQTTNKSISVQTTQDTPRENISNVGYWHPHVDRVGKICFGTAGNSISEILSRRFVNPFEVLVFVTDFLMNGYYRDGSYKWIEFWDRDDGYLCEVCDDFHESGQSCPYRCRLCSEHTESRNHIICEIHNTCFDLPNYCGLCKQQLYALLENTVKVEDLPKILNNDEEMPGSLSINSTTLRYFYVIKGPGPDPGGYDHSQLIFSVGGWSGIASARAPEFALARWDVYSIFERGSNGIFNQRLCRLNDEVSADTFPEEYVPMIINGSEETDGAAVIALYDSSKATYAEDHVLHTIEINDHHRLELYDADYFYCAVHRPQPDQRPSALYYLSDGKFILRSFNLGDPNDQSDISNEMVERLGFRRRFEQGLGIDPNFVIAALDIKHKAPKQKRIPRTRNTKTWKQVRLVIELEFDRVFHSVAFSEKRLPSESEVRRSIERRISEHYQTEELKESHNRFLSAPPTRREKYIAKFFDEKGI